MLHPARTCSPRIGLCQVPSVGHMGTHTFWVHKQGPQTTELTSALLKNSLQTNKQAKRRACLSIHKIKTRCGSNILLALYITSSRYTVHTQYTHAHNTCQKHLCWVECSTKMLNKMLSNTPSNVLTIWRLVVGGLPQQRTRRMGRCLSLRGRRCRIIVSNNTRHHQITITLTCTCLLLNMTHRWKFTPLSSAVKHCQKPITHNRAFPTQEAMTVILQCSTAVVLGLSFSAIVVMFFSEAWEDRRDSGLEIVSIDVYGGDDLGGFSLAVFPCRQLASMVRSVSKFQ